MKRLLKKQLVILLCIAMTAMVAGCSLPFVKTVDNTSTSEEKEKKDKPKKDKTSADPASTDTTDDPGVIDPVPEFDLAVYNDIIKYDYLVLSDNIRLSYGDDEQMDGSTWLYESNSFENVYQRLDSYGYIMQDISGDGVPELLIGMTPTEWSTDSIIYNIWTIKDGEPYLVEEGWGRSRLYLLDDNSIYTEGSSGAAYTCFGTFNLSKDGTETEWNDFYFTEEAASGDIVLFRNTSGEWDRSVSEQVNGSDEQTAYGLMNEYTEKIVKVQFNLFTTLSVEYGDPVDCAFYVYEDDGYNSDYPVYDTVDDEYAIAVRLVARADVKDLTFISLEFSDPADISSYDSAPVCTIGDVDKYKGVIVKSTFTDTLPLYGFSYFDLAGQPHVFALTQSGKDGSIQYIQLQ